MHSLSVYSQNVQQNCVCSAGVLARKYIGWGRVPYADNETEGGKSGYPRPKLSGFTEDWSWPSGYIKTVGSIQSPSV